MLRFGVQLPHGSFEKVQEVALQAEKLGFDTLWFADHIASHHGTERLEAWSVISSLLSRTKKIEVGSGVSDMYRKHPSTLAHIALTLDQISGGRVNLGVGAGEAVNLAPLGIKIEDPLAYLREGIIVIKKLLSSSPQNPVDFHGRFFSLSQAFLNVRKQRPSGPPLYVGAQGPKTAEIVGELADGWYPWLHTRERYAAMVERILKGARKAGRKPDSIELVSRLFIYVTDEREKGLEVVASDLRRSLVIERRILGDLGLNVGAPEDYSNLRFVVTQDSVRTLHKLSESVPIEAVERVSTVGSTDDIIAAIEGYARLGSSHVVIRTYGPDDMSVFARKVIPYFRGSSRRLVS